MKIGYLLAPLAAIAPAAADPLPKQVAVLDCFVGSWKGAGTIEMGKDKAKVALQLDCKRVAGKFGTECTFHMTGMPGVASYDETDLFGYEPNTDTYHWFSVTNAGETHDHAMKNPGDTGKLQWTFTGTQDGKPLKEVIDMEIGKDDKTIAVRSESFVAGASAFVLDAKVHK